MAQLSQGIPVLLLFDLASLGGLPGSADARSGLAGTGTGGSWIGLWALDPAP